MRKPPQFVTKHVRKLAVLVSLTALTCDVSGQSVPKALPVDDAPPSPAPSVPVPSSPGTESPNSIPSAIPVETPSTPEARPVAPRAIPVPSEPPKPARKEPGQDLFDYATLCYSRKDYNLAIRPYMDYVQSYPQGVYASEAWFRLGECYLKLGSADNARAAYNEVMTRHPRSESAASAAYRLGAIVYESLDFDRAANYFELAAKRTTSNEVRLASLYNAGLCYKQARRKEKAYDNFRQVAAIKENNPNLERALSEVASYLLENGKKEDALTAYSELSALALDARIKGDALLKSAIILNDLGESDAAIRNYRLVLDTLALDPEQRGLATFGLIQASYSKGDYDEVIKTYNANASVISSPELQPKLLLVVANAYRQRKDYRQSIQLFNLIEENYGESQEAFEAAYQRVLALYQLGDSGVPEAADEFEKRYGKSYSGNEYLHMARLIRSDWYFNHGDYQKAAEAFSGLNLSQVSEKVRGSALYKKGFAEAESERWNDAIQTFTTFLTDYPTDPQVPVALAQRGVSYKATRAFDRALEDFNRVRKDFSDSPALEVALYQSGLIKGESRDFVGMSEDLNLLVKKFPRSSAAGEAYYRIGKAYLDTKVKDNYAKALEPLRKAIETSEEEYLDKASQLLIACQWLREDVDGLAKEVDAYKAKRADASITPKALLFLGVHYTNRRDFKNSAKYLRMAATPDQPEATEPLLWEYLGMAEFESGNFKAAIESFDHYLKSAERNATQVKVLLYKGRAALALKNYELAESVVQDALKLAREGSLHAELQLLQGDIALTQGDESSKAGKNQNAAIQWKKAAGSYVLVSQFYEHPQITPEALYKAASVLEKLGETVKAGNLRQQLQTKFPKYKPQQ